MMVLNLYKVKVLMFSISMYQGVVRLPLHYLCTSDPSLVLPGSVYPCVLIHTSASRSYRRSIVTTFIFNLNYKLAQICIHLI